jgi:hypothetical protein
MATPLLRGRRKLFLVGGTIALCILPALLFWPELKQRYLLWRLGSSSEVLQDLLSSWPDWDVATPERSALDDYARTERGRTQIVRGLVDPLLCGSPGSARNPCLRGILGFYTSGEERYETWFETQWLKTEVMAADLQWSWGGCPDRSKVFSSAYGPDSTPLPGIAALLGEIAGNDIRIDSYPGLVFRIEQTEEAVRRYGSDLSRGVPAEAGPYACVFWRD